MYIFWCWFGRFLVQSNFWKQVTYVMKTIMEHINISYDGANKSVQIRIVSTEEGMQEDYIEEEQ